MDNDESMPVPSSPPDLTKIFAIHPEPCSNQADEKMRRKRSLPDNSPWDSGPQSKSPRIAPQKHPLPGSSKTDQGQGQARLEQDEEMETEEHSDQPNVTNSEMPSASGCQPFHQNVQDQSSLNMQVSATELHNQTSSGRNINLSQVTKSFHLLKQKFHNLSLLLQQFCRRLQDAGPKPIKAVKGCNVDYDEHFREFEFEAGSFIPKIECCKEGVTWLKSQVDELSRTEGRLYMGLMSSVMELEKKILHWPATVEDFKKIMNHGQLF